MQSFHPDLSDLMSSSSHPKSDMFFRLNSARALENERYNVIFEYIFKFELDMDGALNVLSYEKLNDCAASAIQSSDSTPEMLLYAHYILINLCLCDFQIQVQSSLKYIADNIDNNLLPYLDGELRQILKYTEISNESEQTEFENHDEQQNYKEAPQFDPLVGAEKIYRGNYHPFTEYLEFFNLLHTKNPEVESIYQMFSRLTNSFEDFTAIFNYALSKTEYISDFADFIIISFDIPIPQNLLFSDILKDLLKTIQERNPQYSRVTVEFKLISELVEKIVICAADCTHKLEYYMIAAYISRGHASMSHMLDMVTLTMYNTNLISDYVASFGFDISNLNGYKGYFAFFMQFLTLEQIEVVKNTFLTAKPAYFGESIPYLFNIPFFFAMFDERENDPMFSDPRSNKTVKLLLATQYKRMDAGNPSFGMQCAHSFLNDLCRKFHDSRRQPFPESK